MAKNVKINNVTYENVPQVDIPLATGGGTATFYDTTGADAVAAEILATKKAYGGSGEITGTMPNIGAQNPTITTKAQEITISEGYHDGTGKAKIDATEQAKIIAGNIKANVTILGQQGKASVVDTDDADANASEILSGKTAYVNGTKITGTFTAATVSQDSTTKVLTIS